MAQLSYTIPYGSEWSAGVAINFTVSYDAATNRSTVTFQQSSVRYGGRKGYGSSSATGITVSAGDNPASSGSASFSTSGNSNPAGVSYYGTPSPSVTVQHSAGPGAKTVTLSGSTTISVYPFTTSSSLYNITGSGSTTVTAHTVPYASTIASATSAARTTETFSLSMTRYSSSYWHKAVFTCGGQTLYTSGPFETALSFALPRAWFDGFPDSTSLSVTVSVQTYSDSACTAPVGSPATASLSVTPDSGMAPVIGTGFAAAAPYNAGTAAAGITGYVQGHSRARLTLVKSALTLANNASAARYTVSCQGAAQSVESPGAVEELNTAVLTGAEAIPLTVTVTDSRGLTASTTLSVTPMAYAAPTLSGVRVFRCGSGGTEDEDGTCVSVLATGNISPLGGENSLTMSVELAAGSGGYGPAVSLTSGQTAVLGGTLDPDQRLNVRIRAADSLANTAAALRTLPTRFWAMKFRADGRGVAFGKAPEHGAKKLELPADWDLLFGTESWLNKVYPVGSIYMSVSADDPGALFGGTWERIQDRFLLAAGDSYAAGATGGEATHTLTVDEMPSHYHGIGLATTAPEAANFGLTQTAAFQNRVIVSGNQSNTWGNGGGQAHNNMPPYLAVYMWKRTA